MSDSELNSKEYLEFRSTQSESIPASLANETRLAIHKSLKRDFSWVIARLFSVHLLAGLFTLLFCPQFGIGPLIGGHGLMEVFHHLGTLGCAMACGSVFMVSGILISPLFLSVIELKQAIRQGVWIYFMLSVLSVFLLMLGSGVENFTVGTTFFWIIGAWISSILASRLVLMRTQIRSA